MSEYLEITLTRDAVELPSWKPQANPIWIGTDHAAVAACREALELAERGDMPGLEARLERLYAGLYRAFHENWLVRIDARISMKAALSKAEMLAVRSWCRGEQKAAARCGVLLAGSCSCIIGRMGGRRIRAASSARLSPCEIARVRQEASGCYRH